MEWLGLSRKKTEKICYSGDLKWDEKRIKELISTAYSQASVNRNVSDGMPLAYR
jgi:hypothetical protein